MNCRHTLFRPKAIGLTIALAITGSAVLADWPLQAPDDIDLAPRQIFGLEVNGFPNLKLIGTAFAIDEQTLITARHVVGEHTSFRDLAPNSQHIHIPERFIEIRYTVDERQTSSVQYYQDITVTPSPIRTVDAARLDLVDILPVAPMTLSTCAINLQETYYLLKLLNGEPNEPRVVALTPDPSVFTGRGDLRTFTHNAPPSLAPVSGDSGSPVVDREGHVVGLLTAVDDRELYVTLTRTWLDLVPADVALACDPDPRVWPNRIADLQSEIDQLADQLQIQDQEFRATTDRLMGVINEQRELIDQQIVRIRWLTTRTDSVELYSNAGLSALADTEENISDMVEELRRIIEDAMPSMDTSQRERLQAGQARLEEIDRELADSPSLVPTVREIRELLTRETLRLEARWAEPTEFSPENALFPRWELSYTRDLAAPVFARRAYFCLRPIFSSFEGIRSFNDPENTDFYSAISIDEKGTITQPRGLDEFICELRGHSTIPAADAHVTQGLFRFEISIVESFMNGLLNRHRDNLEQEGIDIDEVNWDGLFHFSVHAQITDGEDYGVILQALVSLNRDGMTAGPLRCESFASEREIIDFLQGDRQLEQRSPCFQSE